MRSDPVDKDTECDLNPQCSLTEGMVQRLEAYFAEDRVHHD